MLYAIIGHEADNALEKRMAARAEHVSRLETLKSVGRLIMAGPFPAIDSENPGPAGFTGSLIVAEFESLDQAQAWANADAYMEQGVFTAVTVKPFKLTLP